MTAIDDIENKPDEDMTPLEWVIHFTYKFTDFARPAAAELEQLRDNNERMNENVLFLRQDGINAKNGWKASIDINAQLRANERRMKHNEEAYEATLAIFRTELDAANKAVDEARVVVGVCKKQIDYACEVGDTEWSVYSGFASARSFINAWLTSHPEGKEE